MSVSKKRPAILLADDDSSVRSFLSRLLQVKGYRVYPAADGEEAARLFRQHADTIGLLLTDLTMPHKNGVDLAVELKRLCPPLPVVFMTGNYLDWQEKLMTLPFPCLEKPFTADALLRAVRSHLSEEGSRVENE